MGDTIDFIFGLFGRVIIRKDSFDSIIDERNDLLRYKRIALKNEKLKEIKRLTKKHSKYIGKWFLVEDETEDPLVCKIEYIRGDNSYDYSNNYRFVAHTPNLEDSIDIEIDDILEGKIKQLTKKEVIDSLGIE